MAQFSWTFDYNTGTSKSHALSKKLYEAAIAECTMMDFVKPVDGFGKKRGETVTLTRIRNITEPTSAVLSEQDRIPEDQFDLSSTSITVSEFGRAVPYTSLAQDLSFFDLENPIQNKLKDQMKLVMDTVAATAFKSSQLCYVPTGLTTSSITTNGSFSGTATVAMNMFHVEEIRDYLFATLHCPPYEGGDYMAVFHTKSIRGIKRDPAWEQWHVYTDPGAKYNGEIGRIEGIRFVETNHTGAFTTTGSGSVLGQGVVFGADAVVMAEAMAPELRAAMPADFGRSQAVAWYGIFAFGLVWDTANAGECRVIRVGSA
jgi:N4-gp56 family major capsid protein